MAKRCFKIRKCNGPYHYSWEWLCTLCNPPAYGHRSGSNAWIKIITISLPKHMEHRHCHHAYVKSHA